MLSPGRLPKYFVTGNRVNYAKPMQVFLLANIFFYFITHIYGITDYSPNFGDHNYYGLSGYWLFSWAERFDNWIINQINALGEWKQAKLHLSNEEFYYTFFENSWIYSKTFIILLIPFYALTIWLFFSKRLKYFGSAVVFSTYFVAFQLFTFSPISLLNKVIQARFNFNIFKQLYWIFFNTPLKYISNLFFSDFELSNIIFWFPYLFVAFQYFFKDQSKWWINLPAALIISKIFYFITFGLYKKLLIVATVLLMHHSGSH